MIMSGMMLIEWLGRKRNEPKATPSRLLSDKTVT